MNPAIEGGSATAATLTRFFIYEPIDGDLRNIVLVGAVLASDQKSARNKHYRGRTEPVICLTLSENQAKPVEWTPPVRQPSNEKPLKMPTLDDDPEQVVIDITGGAGSGGNTGSTSATHGGAGGASDPARGTTDPETI